MRVGQNKNAISILEKITSAGTQDAQVYLVLASAYLTSGDRAKSITALEKAGALNTNLKEQTNYLIGEIKAGRNPQ
jgi:predicted Zn-dependent protease